MNQRNGFYCIQFRKFEDAAPRMKILVFDLYYTDSVGAPSVYFIIHTTKISSFQINFIIDF